MSAIITHSSILTIHKGRILWKKPLKKIVFSLQKVGLKQKNCGLYWRAYGTQLEIGHMLNGTTPEIQHRKSGP